MDKYYITTRYPGQYGGPEGLYDRDDAETAIHAGISLIAIELKIITSSDIFVV